jgi:hypothetical protein
LQQHVLWLFTGSEHTSQAAHEQRRFQLLPLICVTPTYPARVSLIGSPNGGALLRISVYEFLHISSDFAAACRRPWEKNPRTWLHKLLEPQVTKVLVCDPLKNVLLKAGNKNDRIDARKLAELSPMK